MSINTKHMRDLIIIPTLYYLDLYSESAVNLLLGTCAQESGMGTYLKQNGGVALGIYQVEPATHRDIMKRYLFENVEGRRELQIRTSALISQMNQYGNIDSELIFNLRYATAIARIKYLMASDPLPDADDLFGLANYYKIHFNSAQGKATTDEFIENYKRYVTNV